MIYHANKFPVELGGTMWGFTPHPSRDIIPAPIFRKIQFLLHKPFPGGAWGTMRGFTPAPHKGHCPLTRYRILQYDFAGNVPVLQGNAHRPVHKRITDVSRVGVRHRRPRRKPFAKGRLQLCELAAPPLHAETPLKNHNCCFARWLRHCRPRRNPFEKGRL